MGEYYHTQKPHIFRLQPYFKLIKLLGQIFSAFPSKKFPSLPTYFLSHCLPLFSSFSFHFFLLIMQKYLSSSVLKTNWKCYKVFFFLIEIQLTYNIMIVSSVLHCDLTFAYVTKWPASLVTICPIQTYYNIIDCIPPPTFLIPFFRRQSSPIRALEILILLVCFGLGAKTCHIKIWVINNQFTSLRRLYLDSIPVVGKYLICEYFQRDP